MSSSNPSRGKRHTDQAKKNQEKNLLILALIPVARELKPRVIVAENVRQMLTLSVKNSKRETFVVDILERKLPEYIFTSGIINVADYGIPQHRKRAILVGVHRDEHWLCALQSRSKLPWPKGRFGVENRPWVSLQEWLEGMNYESLDSRSPESAKGKDSLHFVPSYDGDRYLQVASIPPYSGKSAYENSECIECGMKRIPVGIVRCPSCACLLRNRPYVYKNRRHQLIAGFRSSYRRMRADCPAPTVTTNSSHVGSDFKIHPFENRVLSIRECIDLQTVPSSFRWDKPVADGKTYAIRVVAGEAFPTYFTYLHGKLLSKCLELPREVPELPRGVIESFATSASQL